MAENEITIKKQSWEIPVKNFRQILFWPFVLDVPGSQSSAGRNSTADIVCQLAEKIEKKEKEKREKKDEGKSDQFVRGWQAVPDLVDHVTTDPGGGKQQGRDHPQSYAEIVYFHDFVQRTLFHKVEGSWPCNGSPIHLLRNTEIKKLEVVVSYGKKFGESCESALNLDVDRLNLYLFSTGVAILATEVCLPHIAGESEKRSKHTLADIEAFSDYFRRWHVPFWAGDAPGLLPNSVKWSRECGKVTIDEKVETRKFYQEKILNCDDRLAIPISCWQRLLPEGFVLANGENVKGDPPVWRSIADDRMATSSFITVASATEFDTYNAIKDADWFRICFADNPGPGWSYRPMSVKKFEEEHCFDWFHEDKTRQVFSSLSHALVAAGDFFPDDILVHHFRRHYFQMMLLAQFEKASLLSFSGRITRAVEKRNSDKNNRDEVFEKTILNVREDFIQFVHRFRFTGVSNQMQATAMYQMWRDHMQLDTLYKDVETELTASTDYIFAIDQRDQTEAAARLSGIASLGVVYGLLFAFLSLAPFKEIEPSRVAVLVSATSFVGLVLFTLHIGEHGKKKSSRATQIIFMIIAMVSLFTSFWV